MQVICASLKTKPSNERADFYDSAFGVLLRAVVSELNFLFVFVLDTSLSMYHELHATFGHM